MLKAFVAQLRTAGLILVLLTILTGLCYPLLVTGLAQLFFPWQANGSLITANGTTQGSFWIGQFFSSPRYFWGRVSATSSFPYNGLASSGSNAGPLNARFLDVMSARVAQLQGSGGGIHALVPADLVTASASGLDPEISPKAAFYQVPRIAKARGLSQKELNTLINTYVQGRTFGLLGEPRVNVLQLNLALDDKEKNDGPTPKS